ncbi:MAG: GAF domain-containing protein [Gemmatimonadetes bacterium]|nr:GAF domain-containing protein [Gemmatimonadota bacterium]
MPPKTQLPPLDLVHEQRLEKLSDEHLRRLLRVSHEFNLTIDIEQLLPRILDLVVETLEAEAGSIWVADGQVVRCRAALGPVADQLTGLELPRGAGIIGQVIEERTSALVPDVHADDRFLPQIDQATGFTTRSLVAVPLVTRGEAVGAIEVINDRSGANFQEDDLLFLEALADDAAAAIRNATLFEAEKRARDLKALLDYSHEITSTFDLDRVLVSVVNLAGRALPFERCAIAIWQGEDLRLRAISGEEKLDRRAAAVKEMERFLLWAAERGEELYVPDIDDDDENALQLHNSFPRYLQDSRAKAVLVLPIQDAEGRLGVLLFEFARAHFLSDWGREAAKLLANETALALRNAQLYAEVPLISWLEPLREKKRALASLPRAKLIRYASVAALVLLALVLVRLPLRVSAAQATVRAAVQRPARAAVSGIVEAVFVREGDWVSMGAPVARIRDQELLRQVRELEAELEQAQRVALAAEARGDLTSAALARVRAAGHADALRLLRQKVDQARVTAPTAGIVLTPRLEEQVGSFVEAGTVVSWIGDPQWAELELRVRQEELGVVHVGDRVRARVSAHPAIVFEGRVVAIGARAEVLDDDVPAYTIRAILDNRESLLRPGMDARARVVTRSRPLGVLLFRRPWRWWRMHFWW